ncbi:hypothetical protein [Jiella avicenniae]|uniref:Uncharacterized protein n=1 Tax=Jiella avicenniae TaxID=2907202 RepID=A0A9X1NYE1_9HYPH|nr:hypothetical protein [Jiella avicenniae]MCE7026404.1 hypothetical protein [Jiella avicenniae]
MAEAITDVFEIARWPLASGHGHRVLAERCGLLKIGTIGPIADGVAFAVEAEFSRETAGTLAARVMAGDETAMTHPQALRILAAAYLDEVG